MAGDNRDGEYVGDADPMEAFERFSELLEASGVERVFSDCGRAFPHDARETGVPPFDPWRSRLAKCRVTLARTRAKETR